MSNSAEGAVGRRRFLTYTAWLAAILGVRPLLPAASPPIAHAAGPLGPGDAFALDTMRAVAVMVFPGADDWSRAQGVSRNAPGPIEFGGGEFLMDLFDHYLAAGDQLTRPVAVGIGEALQDLGIPVAPFLGISPEQAHTVDQALGYAYADRWLPLSGLMALILTFGAVLVAPGSVVGPLGSPFARLSLRDKCRVVELLERPLPDLVSIVDRVLPGPLHGSASGFLQFGGGILLDGAAFAVHSELYLFDPATRDVRQRPPSWELTGYRPTGLVDGQPDLIGYYQGRTEVPADA
ncbi:hypothetical protein ACFYTQ_17955 [Nocardia sp. NPDC004068]|uniref:hypothetical protein n=1 Tax=Nocardia sp. NPDC004068 TaxID=3364303 RepID=UPI0036778F0B